MNRMSTKGPREWAGSAIILAGVLAISGCGVAASSAPTTADPALSSVPTSSNSAVSNADNLPLAALMPSTKEFKDRFGVTMSVSDSDFSTSKMSAVPTPRSVPDASPDAEYQAFGKECVDARKALDGAFRMPDEVGTASLAEGTHGRSAGLVIYRFSTADKANEYLHLVSAMANACSQASETRPNMPPMIVDTSNIKGAFAYEIPNDLGDGDRYAYVVSGRQVLLGDSRVSIDTSDQLLQLGLDKIDAASRTK